MLPNISNAEVSQHQSTQLFQVTRSRCQLQNVFLGIIYPFTNWGQMEDHIPMIFVGYRDSPYNMDPGVCTAMQIRASPWTQRDLLTSKRNEGFWKSENANENKTYNLNTTSLRLLMLLIADPSHHGHFCCSFQHFFTKWKNMDSPPQGWINLAILQLCSYYFKISCVSFWERIIISHLTVRLARFRDPLPKDYTSLSW